MSFYNGPYLRVLTPVTTNGVYPKLGRDGRQEFKQTDLPLTARPALEKMNRKLPDTLKKIIEVVSPAPANNGYVTADMVQTNSEMETMRARIAELEAQNAALQPQDTNAGLFGKAGEEGVKAPQKPKAATVAQ